MRVVAKDVVPVGQQVVGFNELEERSTDRSSQGAGEKETNGSLLSSTRQQLQNDGRKAESFHASSCVGGREAFRIWSWIDLGGCRTCDGVCGETSQRLLQPFSQPNICITTREKQVRTRIPAESLTGGEERNTDAFCMSGGFSALKWCKTSLLHQSPPPPTLVHRTLISLLPTQMNDIHVHPLLSNQLMSFQMWSQTYGTQKLAAGFTMVLHRELKHEALDGVEMWASWGVKNKGFNPLRQTNNRSIRGTKSKRVNQQLCWGWITSDWADVCESRDSRPVHVSAQHQVHSFCYCSWVSSSSARDVSCLLDFHAWSPNKLQKTTLNT